MSDYAKTILTGKIGIIDPARQTENGTKVLNFTLIHHDHNRIMYVNCSVFGKVAENIENVIYEGMQVMIEGRPVKTEPKLEITVNYIKFQDRLAS